MSAGLVQDDHGTEPARRLLPRTRAWLWTTCAALLVLIYLVLWTLYGTTHLSTYARYEQLAPGAAYQQHHADVRLLSLVRTPELAATEGDSQVASPNAVFVVAELEVLPQAKDPDFFCLTELLGPGGRTWDPSSVDAERAKPQLCSDEDLHPGRPFAFEQVYEVPMRYADQLFGVVAVDNTSAKPEVVLTPPR